MLIVLSPAKSLDYATPALTGRYTQPEFMQHASKLVGILRNYSPAQIASLMKISDQLAALNVGRYATWQPQCALDNARQAVLAFSGDVYQGLDAPTLAESQLDWLQAHTRILSGLYGVLRPLDLMQPYRLEMGTRLPNQHGKDLYAFWGAQITGALNRAIASSNSRAVINLASEEYFKAVHADRLTTPVITPVFQDWSGGRYKVVSFHAKRARGLMTRYAVLNDITSPEGLKAFDVAGYAYEDAPSTVGMWIFRRKNNRL